MNPFISFVCFHGLSKELQFSLSQYCEASILGGNDGALDEHAGTMQFLGSIAVWAQQAWSLPPGLNLPRGFGH